MTDAEVALARARRIDQTCDQFESAFKAGKSPNVEQLVAQAPESDRDSLRVALVALEQELRQRSIADTSVTRSSIASPIPADPDATQLKFKNAPLPTRIARFEILGILGTGAFGRVFKAHDPELGRDVALKMPLSTNIPASERERFLRESRAAAKINHPNVCQVFETGEYQGQPYIVMAIVPGHSLAEVLKQRTKPLPAKQIAQVVRKIALALSAAHDRGIVHRDLKPGNIMFDRERKDMIVMDFGMARGLTLGECQATQSGVILGTPAYMSPEQARGESRDVGPASDIFSLGVILYELLSGVRPFTGSATEVIGQILHVEPKPPSVYCPDVDSRLEAICKRAMAKDAGSRYSSMRELIASLDAIIKCTDAPSPRTDLDGAANTVGDQERSGIENQKLTELFAVLSADRKATAAAVERAVSKSRPPAWLLVALALLSFGGLSALGAIIFFSRSEKVLVTISLTNVDLADKTLRFFLDDEPVAAEALEKPIELKPGDHVFTAKRGALIVHRFLLTVSGGRDAGIAYKDITPEPPPLPPKEIVWRPLFRSPEDLVEGETITKLTPQRSVKFDNGNLQLNGAGAWLRPAITGRNYVIRMKVLTLNTAIRATLRRQGASSDGYSVVLQGPINRPHCMLTKSWGGSKHEDFATSRPKPLVTTPLVFSASVFGDQIACYINGEKVLSKDDSTFADGGLSIGFAMKHQAVLRDLEICELDGSPFTPEQALGIETNASASTVSEWTNLFNGKDLAGWKTHPERPGGWTIENGVLIGRCSSEPRHLFSERGDFKDFHLRAECKANHFGGGGIGFRSPAVRLERAGEAVRLPVGYKVKVLDESPKSGGAVTGTLLARPPVERLHLEQNSAVKADEWFTLEVIARGPQIQVLINGTRVAEVNDPKFSKGHLVLQAMKEASSNQDSVIQFRKIEIRSIGEKDSAVSTPASP